MKIKLEVEKTLEPCSSNTLKVDVPGLNIDFWLCITVHVKIWWITGKSSWAIHLK